MDKESGDQDDFESNQRAQELELEIKRVHKEKLMDVSKFVFDYVKTSSCASCKNEECRARIDCVDRVGFENNPCIAKEGQCPD